MCKVFLQVYKHYTTVRLQLQIFINCVETADSVKELPLCLRMGTVEIYGFAEVGETDSKLLVKGGGWW